MAKSRRQRKKLHLSTNKPPPKPEEIKTHFPLKLETVKNIFQDVNINPDSLNQLYETTSEKSFKSNKSNKSGSQISKKEKLIMRRIHLLKNLDTMKEAKQVAKETAKVRDKRSKIPLLGDTNDLHDSLASIEAFLNSADKGKKTKRINPKKKRLLKAKQRKKTFINNLNAYKDLLKQKKFQEDPMKIITQHVNNIVEQQKK